MNASKSELITAYVLALLVVAHYFFIIAYTMPGFAEDYVKLDIDLPAITLFAFNTYPYWSVFSITGIIGAYLVNSSKRKVGWAVLISSVTTIPISVAFMVKAMYAPIFGLEP